MTDISLLLIEPEESTAAYMHKMLTKVGIQVQLAPTGKEGLICAWRDQPDFIVIELELPDIDGLKVVRKLRKDQRTSRKVIVGLTSRSRPEDTVAGLEAGLSEYIVKQADAVDILLRYLASERGSEQLRKKATGPIPSNRLIAFLGAKGGMGTSSICVNVANQLRKQISDGSVVVLDLVLPLGSLAEITGAKQTIDLIYLTDLNRNQLTPEFLRKNLPIPHAWGFYLVPGVNDPHQAIKMHIDRLSPMIQTIRATFSYLVVDLGRDVSQLAMSVLRQADSIVLIFGPDETGVASAVKLRDYLSDEGVPANRIHFLSNRPLATQSLDSNAIELALGGVPIFSLPNMGSDFQLANSLHAPLDLKFPDEPATLTINQVTKHLLQQLKLAPAEAQIL